MTQPATDLTDADAGQILRAYNLRLRRLRRINRGTINHNYWVHTDAGPAFMRVNQGKTEADAVFESELIWHLGSHGLATPQLWRTRASEPYVMWRRTREQVAQPVMLMTWVDAHELTEHELTEDHTYAVGVLLGQLHLCTAGFAHSRPGVYTVARITERLQHLLHDARAMAEVGPLLSELTAEAQDLLRHRELPSGIGHGDLFPDNLLFASRRAVRAGRAAPGPRGQLGSLGWILDLEQAATLPYIYDVAVALLSFCAPLPAGPTAARETGDAAGEASEAAASLTAGPQTRARAQALLAGYQTMRVLGEVEWRALPAELRWAALRFTTTRLTDVARYSHSPSLAPSPAPAPVASAATATARRRGRRALAPGPTHSKDYRDFARRLALLRTVSPEDLIKSLR